MIDCNTIFYFKFILFHNFIKVKLIIFLAGAVFYCDQNKQFLKGFDSCNFKFLVIVMEFF